MKPGFRLGDDGALPRDLSIHEELPTWEILAGLPDAIMQAPTQAVILVALSESRCMIGQYGHFTVPPAMILAGAAAYMRERDKEEAGKSAPPSTPRDRPCGQCGRPVYGRLPRGPLAWCPVLCRRCGWAAAADWGVPVVITGIALAFFVLILFRLGGR